jgi:hypothetical protein
VRAFAEHYGEEITFERLAVTPTQVQLYGLPTAPVKNAAHSHAHSFTGETVQAEALDPRDLAGIVREAIEAHFDMGEYDRVVEREVGERARLLERLKS